MSQILNPIAALLKENQAVKSLSFKNRRLEHLPVDLSGFPKLEQLDLSGNNLKSLPENISKLKNLRVLILADNPRLNLAQVCYILSNCSKLERLDLSNNNLQQVPTELCYLDGLKRLSLDHNPLNALSSRNLMNLPESLKQLSIKECGEGEIDLRLKKMSLLTEIQTTSYDYDQLQQIHFLLPKATVLIQ